MKVRILLAAAAAHDASLLILDRDRQSIGLSRSVLVATSVALDLLSATLLLLLLAALEGLEMIDVGLRQLYGGGGAAEHDGEYSRLI